MKYEAELWTCNPAGALNCEGYVYLEPGAEAPKCPALRIYAVGTAAHNTVMTRRCDGAMRSMGIYELETDDD
jgi:hypothetical protein